jgi:hypothetical protein
LSCGYNDLEEEEEGRRKIRSEMSTVFTFLSHLFGKNGTVYGQILCTEQMTARSTKGNLAVNVLMTIANGIAVA